ncbi:hypothetical protein AB0759_36540 [Scytonema tolypothrichoides VB-61278_2]|uniref:Uncharacterized protein n=2 Tax=Nostocales TaxID=1161 RepID=A0A8S9TBA5_9CYAN|nr:hypothetical protein [Tolypothrix bouteillei]KAF3888894.1 hypothetical protein DA73_0400027990 [Tolypothrix bouteillei VB521301]
MSVNTFLHQQTHHTRLEAPLFGLRSVLILLQCQPLRLCVVRNPGDEPGFFLSTSITLWKLTSTNDNFLL